VVYEGSLVSRDAISRFQILSLDGGGLKGLFSAAFIAQWELQLGGSVLDHFDLVVGTSTGGIISLALAGGFTASDILRFYIENAEEIFPPKAWSEAKHWLDVKHSSEGLKNVLAELLKDCLLGSSRCRLVIPAFEPKFKGIHLFKTAHHRRLMTDYKIAMVDVALAMSAAPTYLKPFIRHSGLEHLDGGLWANNPVMIAVSEALGYLEQAQSRIAALRIGTTQELKSLSQVKTKGGKLFMAAPIIEFMMKGQSQSASGMARHVLGETRYHEVNPVVADGDFKMDVLNTQLVALADAEWRHHSSELADKGFFSHKAQPFKPCYTV
jgi:patatin-like phospholipase/acyl hydrolase